MSAWTVSAGPLSTFSNSTCPARTSDYTRKRANTLIDSAPSCTATILKVMVSGRLQAFKMVCTDREHYIAQCTRTSAACTTIWWILAPRHPYPTTSLLQVEFVSYKLSRLSTDDIDSKRCHIRCPLFHQWRTRRNLSVWRERDGTHSIQFEGGGQNGNFSTRSLLRP